MKRHILIITTSDFPLYEGLGVRIENLARAYTQHGHNVTIYAPNLEKSLSNVEEIESYKVIRVGIPSLKVMARFRMLLRSYSMIMQALLSFFVYSKYLSKEKIDVIQAEQVYAIPSGFIIKLLSHRKLFVDDITTVTDMLKNAGHRVIAFLFSIMERLFFFVADEFIYTSDTCQRYCMERGARSGFHIPNGVDVDKFIPKETSQGGKRVFFNCSAYFYQNIQALRNFLVIGELVRKKKLSDVRFHLICGPRAVIPKDLLEEMNASRDWLEYEDTVSDIVPKIQEAHLTLLPYSRGHHLTGGGRLKALEFLSCGKLVVSTPEGVEGIRGLVAGKHAVIVDSIDEMATVVQEAVEDFDCFENIRAGAREFIVEHYDWKRLVQPMIERLANLSE